MEIKAHLKLSRLLGVGIFSHYSLAAMSKASSYLQVYNLIYTSALGMAIILPVIFIWQSPSSIWINQNASIYSSLIIFIFFSSLALIVAFTILRQHNREYRVAELVHDKVNSDLRIIDGNKEALRPSDTEPTRYIPTGEGQTVVAKLVGEHYQAAEALRSDDGIATLIIANELDSGRGSLRVFASFALRVGILLTFFGLLIGLAPIGAALQADAGLGEVPIGELLSGLTVSFTSSIAGLSAALVIGVLSQAAEHSFRRLRVKIEELGRSLRKLYSRVRFGGDLAKTVDHLSEVVRSHTRDIESHGVQVERSIGEVVSAFRSHTQETGEIMTSVARSTDDLHKLGIDHQDAVGKISDTIDKLAQLETKWNAHADTLISRSSDNMNQHAANLATAFAQHVDTLTGYSSDAFKEHSERISATVTDHVDAFQRRTEELESSKFDNLQEAAIELSQTTRILVDKVTTLSARQDEKQSEIINALHRLDDALKTFGSSGAKNTPLNWLKQTLFLLLIAVFIYFGAV